MATKGYSATETKKIEKSYKIKSLNLTIFYKIHLRTIY